MPDIRSRSVTPRMVVSDPKGAVAFLRGVAAYARAIAADAESIEDPTDTFYRDRRAMVRDPHGNVFQIAHRRPT